MVGERLMLRDEVFNLLSADGLSIVKDSLRQLMNDDTPTIVFHGRLGNIAGKSLFDIENVPKFAIFFGESSIEIEMSRSTTCRVLAHLPYEDPAILDSLRACLLQIGVYMRTTDGDRAWPTHHRCGIAAP